MSNIPLAREILQELEGELRRLPEPLRRPLVKIINKAMPHLDRRRSNVRRAALGSRAKMTPKLAAQIKEFAATHPTWDHQRIAEKFNVVNGRVSETLYGKNK